jgi:hypothetical protein
MLFPSTGRVMAIAEIHDPSSPSSRAKQHDNWSQQVELHLRTHRLENLVGIDWKAAVIEDRYLKQNPSMLPLKYLRTGADREYKYADIVDWPNPKNPVAIE